VQNKYLDGRNVRNCSAETETLIDEAVRRILTDCQSTAIGLLNDNREALDNIAEYLLEKENITGEEFMRLLGTTGGGGGGNGIESSASEIESGAFGFGESDTVDKTGNGGDSPDNKNPENRETGLRPKYAFNEMK
jgi:hypothetical protein